MKASQSIHQFPADVMPLQKSSGWLNWCPSIHPSTTEKISISLRPGLGLRSTIQLLHSTIERNPNPGRSEIEIFSVVDGWMDGHQFIPPPPRFLQGHNVGRELVYTLTRFH